MRGLMFFILFLFEFVSLAGCRAKLETSRNGQRERADEIGVELRRVDSLWSSLAEKLTYRIEFYGPEGPELGENFFSSAIGQGSPWVPRDLAAAPDVFMSAAQSHLEGAILPAGGGMGAVKSIEVSAEREGRTSGSFKTDSVFNSQSLSKEDIQSANFMEARQDNGTVAIVSIVLAAAGILLLLVLIRTYVGRWL